MAELKKEMMQKWNKGPAHWTGIENLKRLILSLTESDQRHKRTVFTGQNDHVSQCICRGVIELMINVSELMIRM